MTTRAELRVRVEAMYDKIRPDLREYYKPETIRGMAIQRVREELEADLEGVDWDNPFGYALIPRAARLTLFNSMYWLGP